MLDDVIDRAERLNERRLRTRLRRILEDDEEEEPDIVGILENRYERLPLFP